MRDIQKPRLMKNRICETCFSFLALFLMACGISVAIFTGMLFMPLAFIAVFALAVREIIVWKRNKKLSAEESKIHREVAASQSGKGTIRYMHNLNSHERVA